MEKNYEKQIFPEEGNILGTVKFKFPGEEKENTVLLLMAGVVLKFKT